MTKKKLVMDDATRKKLMGYTVVSDSIEFTPTIDGVDPEFLPTFNIRSIPIEDQRRIKFMYIDAAEGKKFTQKEKDKREEYLNDITMRSIVGFSNVLDLSKDDIVEWKAAKDKDYIDQDLYNSLPALLKVLIMNEVLSINGLSA